MSGTDPTAEMTLDEAIADLLEILAQLPAGSSEALKAAELVRRLRALDDAAAVPGRTQGPLGPPRLPFGFPATAASKDRPKS